jgi:epoxyqueuosine reductase
VIGINWRREQGLLDPLMAKVMKDMGLDTVPLYDNSSAYRVKCGAVWVKMGEFRDGPVNPERVEINDIGEITEKVRARGMQLGADFVGITKLRPIFIERGVELPHQNVIAVTYREDYEKVTDGPRAVEIQAAKAYAKVARISTKLAAYIRKMGYPALAHHNGGTNVLAIPILYQMGFGELGKHGSLINPTYGASFRPGFVTTSMPLDTEADQPHEFGVQDFCESCNLCTNNCPGDAIPDDYVITEGIKRWLTDIEKCYPISRFSDSYCHLCVDVCPYNAPLHKETYKAFLKERKAGGYKTPKPFEPMESTDEQKAMARKVFVGNPADVAGGGSDAAESD